MSGPDPIPPVANRRGAVGRGRAAVVDWARARGALIVEDDYDAELRYDRAPVGAIQGLAPELVAYAGTASKTVAPGFRVGWLVLPHPLVEQFAEAKLLADRGSPVLDQLTFADFLRRGELTATSGACGPCTGPGAMPSSCAGAAPPRPAPGRNRRRTAPRRVATPGTARGRGGAGGPRSRSRGGRPRSLSSGAVRRGGLIFGYSSISESAIRRGVDLLADAIDDLRGRDRPDRSGGATPSPPA